MESKQTKTFTTILALHSDTKDDFTTVVGTSHSLNPKIRCQASTKEQCITSLARDIDRTELANIRSRRVALRKCTQNALYPTKSQTIKGKASSFLSTRNLTIKSEKEGSTERRKQLVDDNNVSRNFAKEGIPKTRNPGSFKNLKNQIKLLKSHPLWGRPGKVNRAIVRPNLDLLRNVVLGQPGSTPFARRKAEVKRRSGRQAKRAIRLFSPSTPDMIARAKRPQLFAAGAIHGAKKPRLLELD